jgi:ribosomal protein S1
MRIIFACTFLFSSLFSFSQDQVILIAGTVVEGKVTEVSGDTVIVSVKNKEGFKP